jgi:hypothetical protein
MSTRSLSPLPLTIAMSSWVLALDHPDFRPIWCIASVLMIAVFIINLLRAGGGIPRGPSRWKPA